MKSVSEMNQSTVLPQLPGCLRNDCIYKAPGLALPCPALLGSQDGLTVLLSFFSVSSSSTPRAPTSRHKERGASWAGQDPLEKVGESLQRIARASGESDQTPHCVSTVGAAQQLDKQSRVPTSH